MIPVLAGLHTVLESPCICVSPKSGELFVAANRQVCPSPTNSLTGPASVQH
jgi:hypothetical protein